MSRRVRDPVTGLRRVPASERKNLDWVNTILPVAREIVLSYNTAVTLRQLFYRLVSLPHGHPGRIPNTASAYTVLSRTTAEGRRDGTFPDLIDQGAEIVVPAAWESPREGIEALRDQYRRDRTDGQPYQLWLGTEKLGMINQMRLWFRDRGIPIVALGGHGSQSYVDMIRRRADRDGRPAILLYAGDHDPSGWRILSSFVDRTGFWANPQLPEWNPEDMPADRGLTAAGEVIPNYDRYRKYRVALQPEQCDEYGLARNSAKEKDPNLAAFLANFAHTLTADEIETGNGVQVEMDAVDPNTLRQLYTDAVESYWDEDAYQAALADEGDDVETLDAILADL